MAAAPTARPWPWIIALLAMALVAVLAIGAWAMWRPLSDYDAARLTARDLVTSVGESSSSGVPRETVDRQLSALGPAATPAQRDRLEERAALPNGYRAASGTGSADARGGVAATPELPSAVREMTERAKTQEDPELATTMAGIAASWSADMTRQDSAAAPLMRAGAPAASEATEVHDQETSSGATDRCTPELTSVATQLDRSLFTAQSAEVRGTESADMTQAVDNWQENLERIRDEPPVAALYTCEPYPARGGYDLPPEISRDPAAAGGEVAQDLSEYTQSAIAAASPAERSWLLDLLESSTRAQAMLRPSDPVPALAGEHQVSGR